MIFSWESTPLYSPPFKEGLGEVIIDTEKIRTYYYPLLMSLNEYKNTSFSCFLISLLGSPASGRVRLWRKRNLLQPRLDCRV